MAKRILTADQVAEIKAAGALRRTLQNKLLARKFGVSPCTIRNVLNDDAYKRMLKRKKELNAERRVLANLAKLANTATFTVQKI